MADPSSYRPRPGEIPTDPGVYRFRDKDGRVIYVGKAKSLRPRLSSYFQDLAGLHPRTQTMVRTGASVEWTVVATEVEALQLEYSWIKEFDPRFNVKYRDDKSYPYLAVTMGEEFPRAQVLRGAKRPGTRYFGPYAHAWAIRETLDQLLRVFPVRTCSKGVFHRAKLSGRPCLLGYLDKCCAPCVGRTDAAAHREVAEELCDFLAGNTGRFVRRLEREMRAAAEELDFETAARLRDDLGALERALERSAVVLADGTDADVFGMAGDELEVAVQVFHVRGGRVRGQRGWVSERESADDAALVQALLMQVYAAESAEGVPREVLVPLLPEDGDAVAALLSEVRGSRVSVRVPQRGDKRALAQTVTRNAEQALARHKVARAGDLTARGQALADLQEALGLAEAPLRIECFDVSHVQGTNVVASMVVFEDGLPRKGEYRRFIVTGAAEPPGEAEPSVGGVGLGGARGAEPPVGEEILGGPRGAEPPAGGVGLGGARGAEPPVGDDTAAMREVLTRRFRRQVEGGGEGRGGEGPTRLDPETGKPRRFAYAPQLVVVDGGPAQVAAAQAAMDAVGVTDVALVGLAKRLEEVWLPGEEFPVILPRGSDALFLLQRLRDEAHRFAITFHRQRRSKAMTASALDEIPGLGPARKAALLKAFGSVKAMRAASPQELAGVPGIGPALAEVVAARLSAGAAQAVPAVNVTTGEILA